LKVTKTVAITDLLANKIENATKGLIPSHSRSLSKLSPKQISIICDYVSALGSEIKLSDRYRQSIINTLTTLSRVSNKGFKDFTREDVITYLNRFRKEENIDPTHKWIGTYNTNLVNVIRFFRWLYSPNLEPSKRPKPKVVQNLAKFKRREISGYKPSDMWAPEDNLLFLKYCPSPRDRCYHAMEVDTSARPHELLKLRIKDVEFISGEDGSKYAKIVVNGKTGERALPLIDSIPYVTQWISLHPQGTNREAILLPNMRTGKEIRENSMLKIYTMTYREYFTSLLSSEDVPEEDKKKIRGLLNKPWNPYVHRHSALTEKSKMLSSDAKLRQYAGWMVSSNMHRRYVHFNGDESMNDLLRIKGILKDEKQSVNILQPKTCPHCREPNRPDAQFCFRCHFIMSFDAYQKGMEERERKNQEILELKEQMAKMNDLVGELNHAVQFYKPVFDSVMKEANPHLDPSGFEISPFDDETTNFLRRRGMKETSTTQG
jgi:integrase/recombinase XerD